MNDNYLGYLKILLWIAFVFFSITMIAVIPTCYVPARMALLSQQLPWLLQGLPEWDLMRLLSIDRSGGTIVCITLFLGVLMDYLDSRTRLAEILAAVPDEGKLRFLGGKDQAVKEYLVKKDREEFAGRLWWECRLDQYENFLVAIGLLGTLLAFYLGFARELAQGMSFAALSQTAEELLTVVGTAAISSVSGVGLGMLAARPLADDMEKRIEIVLTALRERNAHSGSP